MGKPATPKLEEKHVCEHRRHRDWRVQTCANAGKVERNGKWYCGVHDPKKREDRQVRWHARYDAERAQSAALDEVKGFERQLLAVVQREYDRGALNDHGTLSDAVKRLRKAQEKWQAARSARMALPPR